MIKTVRIVYDSNNKKVFKFPIDTILDNVIPDLWHDIIGYANCEIFIGDSTTKYYGFRPMKKEEFNEKQIMDYYGRKSFGIFEKSACEFLDFVIEGCFVHSQSESVKCFLGNRGYDRILFSVRKCIMDNDCEIYISNEIANTPPYYTFFVPNLKI